MSLNYDLTQTSLPRDDQGRRLWTEATESIIFYTMTVGIGRLNAETAPEFYARVHLFQSFHNTASRITAADIHQHIGLTTNANYKGETRAQWLKRIVGRDMTDTAQGFALAVESTTTKPVLPPPRPVNTGL